MAPRQTSIHSTAKWYTVEVNYYKMLKQPAKVGYDKQSQFC